MGRGWIFLFICGGHAIKDLVFIPVNSTNCAARTRRNFLKFGTATAATLGFPAIVSARSPNSKLNIACIGVGGRGVYNTEQMATKDNIATICDVNATNLASAKRRYPKAKTFVDFRKLYDTGIDDIDAVVVTIPYSPAPPPVGNIAFNPKPKEGSFPKASASFHDRYGGIPASAHDGKIVCRATPTNRWTCYGSPNQDTDWFALDFGEKKKFARVILHIYDDRGGVQAPRHYRLERWKDDQWQEIPNQKKSPQKPVGSAANTVLFPPVESSKLRVVFSHLGKGHTRSGLTEIEVWSE
jgi:hypothetical protein